MAFSFIVPDGNLQTDKRSDSGSIFLVGQTAVFLPVGGILNSSG
jgi:hypothetical protein